jgi:hypothetical protein
MRVLGAVLQDIRGASPHQHSEQSNRLELIGDRVFVLSFGFYLRDFCCPFQWSQSRRCQMLYFTVYSGLYTVLYYYYFVYSVFGLFYSFSLPYARLVVRTWRN